MKFLGVPFFFFIFFLSNTFAATVEERIHYMDQLTLSTGMSTVSYAETSSSVQSSSTGSSNKKANAASGTITGLVIDATYEHFSKRRRSFFGKGSGTVITGASDKYFAFGGGMNFYLKSDGTMSEYREEGQEITFIPKLRYYVGWNGQLAYLVYQTKTAVKSDMVFEIGGHGGVIYNTEDRLGYKCEAGVFRGTGVKTTSMNIQMLFGITYFID